MDSALDEVSATSVPLGMSGPEDHPPTPLSVAYLDTPGLSHARPYFFSVPQSRFLVRRPPSRAPRLEEFAITGKALETIHDPLPALLLPLLMGN